MAASTITYYARVTPTQQVEIPYSGTANLWAMVTTSNLAAVEAAGFLNANLSPQQVFTNQDFIWMAYSGGVGVFTPTVNPTNGVITLGLSQNLSLPKSSATVVSNAVSATTQGAVLTTPALTTASGSAYSFNYNNALITAGSIVTAQVMGGTNTVAGITTVCTPAAGSATILVQNSGVAAAALNGTVVLGVTIS